MIAIIDYGMGNLRSVKKAFEKLDAESLVTSNPEEVLEAEKVVLPGVGAFPDAMKELRKRKLVSAIKKVISDGKPYLGMCLGLQLLFTESKEGGGAKGLGILDGTVERFHSPLIARHPPIKVPHTGWNQVTQVAGAKCPLLKDIPDNSYMYFVHSYYVKPDDKSVIAATTDYGVRFASVIWNDNIFATQFHPEKSQELGLRILENFIKC